jgi:hypothetical protein
MRAYKHTHIDTHTRIRHSPARIIHTHHARMRRTRTCALQHATYALTCSTQHHALSLKHHTTPRTPTQYYPTPHVLTQLNPKQRTLTSLYTAPLSPRTLTLHHTTLHHAHRQHFTTPRTLTQFHPQPNTPTHSSHNVHPTATQNDK